MRPVAQSILLASALALTYTFSADGKPRLQTGPDAEITHDGLHRVDRSTMDGAWVKPDLDLRPYNKLMLKGAEIQYRAVDSKGRYYRPGLDDDTEFALSDESKEMRIEVVREAFLEELGADQAIRVRRAQRLDQMLMHRVRQAVGRSDLRGHVDADAFRIALLDERRQRR